MISQPVFLSNSLLNKSNKIISIYLAPMFLSECVINTFENPGLKDENVTVNLLWPKSTNATILGLSGFISYFLKKP